ncbi:cysteine--tRNA ligase [Helicobacter sp. MIT 14-3879]|uniref:cysteine--tRNA ligase n=1 Tax=Helicobacter sp. MIT 14-3879 TaxID=2040649 RepID=UPI000E1EEA6D|nr:cysteine--tRNA ligase [Helicobacter sp. MIT 14-3879]RDU61430.1 cysteine--tRNA ligase [Helicobacter sp. MIT 14-3879]
MKIYDSSLKEKVSLIPLNPNEIRIYVCGPTVYDNAHLGHARSAISFDILARFLEVLGYHVVMAKNFTDIDDKLINKALQTNTPLEKLAQTYIQGYLADMQSLNVRRPNFEPRATEFLESISEFIQVLLDKQVAYSLPNGDICLEVAKDSQYGNLSKHINEEHSVHRVAIEEGKKDARDFVLWKAYKGEKDIGYESKLGKGRPGWHIECSAMVDSVLAYKDKEYCIDIHAGGADLFFPHHENEASQTRSYANKEIAKYWMHNGFVTINGEKMSKSLGNSFFIKDALQAYHGEILRNYLLGTHYRLPLNFNEIDLLASKKRLDRIYRLKKRLLFMPSIAKDSYLESNHTQMQQKLQELLQRCDQTFKEKFIAALSDDLNISLALSVVEEFLKEVNEYLDSHSKNKSYKAKACANLELIDIVLGLGSLDFVAYFQLGVSTQQRDYIENLIAKRAQAKKDRNFVLADSIRKQLEEEEILLMDKAGGITEWEKL